MRIRNLTYAVFNNSKGQLRYHGGYLPDRRSHGIFKVISKGWYYDEEFPGTFYLLQKYEGRNHGVFVRFIN